MDQDLLRECVHCGFCLPTCPTYALWGEEMDSPRGRIWLMQARLDGTVELNRTVVEHFDRCLGCMACVTSCPSGVQYDRLIELTRERVEAEHERPPPDRLRRALVFAVVPHRRRLRAALALAPLGRALPLPRALRPFAELAPRWSSREAPPARTPASVPPLARVGLLTGCVQSVVFGGVNAATARVLAAAGYEVLAPARQGCCGALSTHAGRREEGLARARRAVERLERAGAEIVVTNAAGCGSHLKDHGTGVRVADVSELLAESPVPLEPAPLPLRVAFQDACHLAHAQGLRAEPRALLARIPGLELLEPADQAICCGSAGIYNLVQPAAARELGDRKAARILATAPEAYASANPGCLVQVSAALRRAGGRVPAFHPVELLDAALRGIRREDLLANGRV